MSIDINSPLWTPQDAGNIAPIPDGLPSGTVATKLYPLIWAERGAIKREYLTLNPTATATKLSTNPLVYVLNYPEKPTINDGKRFSFWIDSNNVAGAIRLMINGDYYDLKSFEVNTNGDLVAEEMVTTVPVDIVYSGTRFVLENSQVFNVNGLSGTIADARLPTTQAGKTFTSTVRVTAGTPLVLSDTGTTLTVARNQADSIDISAFKTDDETTKNRIDINRTGGVVTVNGSRVLTLADTGAGKGLDADKLDDQHGSFYLARENHTGTQPVSTITGLDTALNVKVSKAGDTMTGNLAISNGSNPTPITFNAANGSITAGGLVHIQSSGTNAAVLEMRAPANASAIIDFSPNGYGGDFVWRINAHPDTASFDIIHTGTHRFRLRNDGAIWNSYSGWLHDKFADRGAQIQHNSGVWEFGSIDPNYNDRTTDAPNPWVLVGLRGTRGTNVINMRAIWLRNN